MEYIPVVDGSGKPMRFLAIVNDIVKSVSRDGVRWFLWIDDVGVDVTEFVENGVLRLGSSAFDLERLFDKAPWLFARTIDSVDDYVQLVKDMCLEAKGKRVSQAFSGGKDSSVALLALTKLSNIIDMKLDVVYVHMPFIEPDRNVSEAIRIARRVGVDVTVVEPPRREVLRELYRHGLPKRGCRICTYFKVAPLRFRSKALGIDLQAYGDRMWEAGKRFERLFYRFFLDNRLVSKNLGFTVIAPLTIVDVVEECREHSLVHYMYLRGAHRVSCVYCPQKPIFELVASGMSVEDPGLIESIMRREWERAYSRLGIEFEEFRRFHLWRFSPRAARNLLEAKLHAEKLLDRGAPYERASDIIESLRSLWLYGIEAPRIRLRYLMSVLREVATKLVEHRKSSRSAS